MRFVLASNSPRRRELLASVLADFTVEPSRYREVSAGLPARETALSFARGKAEEVFSRRPGCAVLGADTVVCLKGRILGKPKDGEEAFSMLRALSGKEHAVYTGLCLLTPAGRREETVKTRVFFRPLSEELIEEYVKSGLPMDKAGAYGIQDGYPLVERYEGSYTNVVGLPLEALTGMLRAAALL